MYTSAVILDHKLFNLHSQCLTPDAYKILLFHILSQRVNQCLQNACSVSNISSCKVFRDCGLNFGIGGQNEQISQQWSNEPASTACFDTGNDTNFQYGIYQQAVLLATKHSAVTRYVYSLFWGFQVFYIYCPCSSISLRYPFCCTWHVVNRLFHNILPYFYLFLSPYWIYLPVVFPSICTCFNLENLSLFLLTSIF